MLESHYLRLFVLKSIQVIDDDLEGIALHLPGCEAMESEEPPCARYDIGAGLIPDSVDDIC